MARDNKNNPRNPASPLFKRLTRLLSGPVVNYRTQVAHCDYRIGGLTDVVEVNGGSDEERLDKAIRDFLALGRDKAKKPSNVKV